MCFFFFFNFYCVIFVVFVKFLKERMQDTRTKKKAGKSVLQKGAKFSHLLAKFGTRCEFSHLTAAPFCFTHNFLIRTPFWVILVSLESLESVESKYNQKEHFLKLL